MIIPGLLVDSSGISRSFTSHALEKTASIEMGGNYRP